MVLKQPIDYSFIAQAGSQLGSAIASIPEEKRKEEEYAQKNEEYAQKKKLLDEQLSDLKVDKIDVQEAYSNRITEMAKEYDALAGDGKGIVKARQFLTPYMQSEDPKDAVARMAIQTDKWKKFIEDEKVRQFQAKSANTSPVGPEGPVQTMTLPEMSAYGAEQGITQRPEFKGRVQQQQDVEAGMMSQPDQTKGQYLSIVSAAGIDPSTGAAKEIGASKMTEYQLSSNEIKKQANEIKEQAAKAMAIYRANLTLHRGKALDAKARSDIQRLQQLAIDAKTKAMESVALNRRSLAAASETGWQSMEADKVSAATDAIEAVDRQAAEYDKVIQGYQDILDGKLLNTLPTTPTAGAAPRPRRSLDSFSK